MPISGVRLGGGPEYQLPSQETLVLAKAAVMASVSSPLTMMPRLADLFPLVAEDVAGAGALPAGLGAVTGVAVASTAGAALEVGATTGAAATVEEVSATAGVDALELGSAPIPARVMAEFTEGESVLEPASIGEAEMGSIGEEVPAWVGTGA